MAALLAEITNELMYETLKKVHADLSSVKTTVGELKSEMNNFRGHLHAMQGDIRNIYTVLAKHDEQLERIEHRLELRELAEAQAKFDRDN